MVGIWFFFIVDSNISDCAWSDCVFASVYLQVVKKGVSVEIEVTEGLLVLWNGAR